MRLSGSQTLLDDVQAGGFRTKNINHPCWKRITNLVAYTQCAEHHGLYMESDKLVMHTHTTYNNILQTQDVRIPPSYPLSRINMFCRRPIQS
jgi:hypothetical protein